MSNQNICVVARFVALPEKAETLKAVLLELVEPTRQEAGCLKYELFQNQSEPTDFTFVEEWASNDALDTHLESAHIKALSNQLDGLIAAEPDICRYTLVG
ncbi:MAG: antibiotic biosynthesis monooxygenase [Chroococcidiopsidaceae cyanobacterium CP_BM_ER_R8_30]|nr:antibiotic biosynthesis monooxygenase [Chroococcidiopsidaceae cyanobacterium CP_BM_ER_R8_30]